MKKPVSRELLQRAGNYVIARSFSGAMGVLVVDLELSASSFYGVVFLLCKRRWTSLGTCWQDIFSGFELRLKETHQKTNLIKTSS